MVECGVYEIIEIKTLNIFKRVTVVGFSDNQNSIKSEASHSDIQGVHWYVRLLIKKI